MPIASIPINCSSLIGCNNCSTSDALTRAITPATIASPARPTIIGPFIPVILAVRSAVIIFPIEIEIGINSAAMTNAEIAFSGVSGTIMLNKNEESIERNNVEEFSNAIVENNSSENTAELSFNQNNL